MRTLPIGFLAASQPGVFSGALDPYTSGLWSAFGLRRLLTSHTGPLIRVRRSSDDAEQDIGYTTAGDLDTSALESFVGSGSSFVVRAYDQSGGANHFDPPSPDTQPRVVSAGVYDGAMRFDGADDRLLSVNPTPAVTGLTFAGRYRLRATDPGGPPQSIMTQGGAGLSGRNPMLYQQQSATGNYGAFLFEGGGYFTSEFASFTTSDVADVLVGNRSLAGAAKLALWRGGVALSPSASGGPGVSAAAFTAETLYVGWSPDGHQPAQMDGRWFAMWQTDKSADAAAISAAL